MNGTRKNSVRERRKPGPRVGISRVGILILLIGLLLGASLVYFFVVEGGFSTGTAPLGGKGILESQLRTASFGAVTQYALPSPVRSPNAITVAPDGSVWFGEEAVPGVGHLYPNGTLVEYAWPFKYQTAPNVGGSPVYKTDIWGVALWNGRVWASDTAMNQLVGLDPSTGSFTTVHLPTNDSFPYTITVGSDGSLWFTEISSSKIGRVFPNGTLVEYPLLAGGHEETPTEIAFLNSTLGYYVTVGGTPGRSTSALYAFNPSKFSPRQVIGNGALSFPNSLALTDGRGIWIDLHGPSMVGFYNLTNGAYTLYPTSTITYTNTVLPYFIRTNDSSSVWFNEHYGNKIAVIDTVKGTLTEYSESDPPADNGSKIYNSLTFALGHRGAWFTALSGNFIGYVDASYRPSYSVAVDGDRTIQLKPGQKANVTISVTGDSSQPLAIQFSDSETFTALPKNLVITSNVGEIESLTGRQNFVVTIVAEGSLTPGNYTVLVTVSGGLVQESVYLFLRVQS
jgi:virginiamycin B lyase